MPRLIGLLTFATLLALSPVASADEGEHPTYQRGRGGWDSGWAKRRPHDWRRQHRYGRRGHRYSSSHVSGGQFQRPYPYHLDYYRMRWGGSYEPYFGNLYGPPNVVLGAPYFYGGGYYGGGGYPAPYEQPAVPYDQPAVPYSQPPVVDQPAVMGP